MKKFLVLAAIFSHVFIMCSDPESQGSIIGSTGPGGGIIFFAQGDQYMECSGELGDTTWANAITAASNFRGGGFTDWRLPTRAELDLMHKNLRQNNLGGFSNGWYWSSEEYNNASYAWAQNFSSRFSSQDYQSKSYSSGVRAVRGYTTGSDTTGTTLKINNQSFTEITDVIWQGVSFANNQYENSIKSGTTVISNVDAGAGYIFFKRNTNPITARTSELIIIENGGQIEFTFTNNTLIIEANNPNNTGTLSDLSSTVVWFDDAEGDYLPYQQRSNTVYSTTEPRYGERSIYINSSTGELSFNLFLERNAKISFWHRASGSNSSSPALFLINDVEIRRWTVSNEWSFFEQSIAAGSTTIKFTTASYWYLYLDNLLIYYTD